MKRRSFLRGVFRGASVAVALPLLETMLDGNGEALADGTDLPSRFGIWFWGNGVRPEKWVPTTTGINWTANSETEPLTPHRSY